MVEMVRTNTSTWLFRVGAGRFLTFINVLSAALAFASGAYVARILGPEGLGVVAIIAGINGSLLAFVDVRLNDIGASAFVRQEGVDANKERVRAYQAGVLWVAVAGTTLLSVVTAVLASVVGQYAIPLFTTAPVAAWWLPLGAVTAGVNSVAGTLLFFMRFSGAFYSLGLLRFSTQALSVAMTIFVLWVMPEIDGVYLASALAALVSLILVVTVSGSVWIRSSLPLLQPDWSAAVNAYKQSASMLLYGNFLSYAKLLQRSADVLLVGLFASDREAGLYKLARTLVDSGLAIPQDATYQVYFPGLYNAFARKAEVEYRRLATELLRNSGLLTLILLVAELLVLPQFVTVVFGAAYSGVELPVMILTATYVFIAGCYPWLWAAFTGSGKLGEYTIAVFCATAVQYVTVITLFSATNASATAAVIGVFAYYVFLVPVSYYMAQKRWAGFMPLTVPWIPRMAGTTT